jgi:hypothetical protein
MAVRSWLSSTCVIPGYVENWSVFCCGSKESCRLPYFVHDWSR